MNNKRDNKRDQLRITTQFRAGSAMVYDFGCDGETLTVRVFPKTEVTDPDQWRIEARTTDSPESQVIARWGPTRTDALQAVGESWRAQAALGVLPHFDWHLVEEAMGNVRAL